MEPTESVNTEIEQKPKYNPLFLPEGSVRALMALTVISAFVAICLYTKNIEMLAILATVISKDYFVSKKE